MKTKYRVTPYKSEDTLKTYCIQMRKWYSPKWVATENKTRYRVESEATMAMTRLALRDK